MALAWRRQSAARAKSPRESRTCARANSSRPRGAWLELRVGQALLQRGEVGVGELAAQQGGQPGVGRGVVRLEPQRRAERRLGLGHLAQLFVSPPRLSCAPASSGFSAAAVR